MGIHCAFPDFLLASKVLGVPALLKALPRKSSNDCPDAREEQSVGERILILGHPDKDDDASVRFGTVASAITDPRQSLSRFRIRIRLFEVLHVETRLPALYNYSL